MKLFMSGKYEIQLVNDESTQEFDVLFEGPADSHYEGVSSIANDTNGCTTNSYYLSILISPIQKLILIILTINSLLAGHVARSRTATRLIPI